MIKNQLYPYLEKYINDYLYGFTKEQLNVGLTSGIIALDVLNIKPDRVNEKLDTHEIPIWLKAGIIKKIKIQASLMNFIGEKPLEVSIEDIDCVISPSFKWILKNLPTFIEENEFHIKESYDPMDNNSHDIFSRKVNIYDSSVIKKQQLIYELFSDKTKLSEIINKIFTKCLKFFYQKAYLVNLKVKRIHLRFEDDQLLNYHSDLGLGVRIGNLELNLTADGVAKKNSFKMENLNVYWEPNPKSLIPSKTYIDSLDRDNNINEKFYEYLKGINFSQCGSTWNNNTKLLVDNFNCMGNFGIQIIESGNLDFFAKNREKNYKFFIQVATSELNLNVFPDVFLIAERIVDFMRSFFIIESIQDFKPMRKPYNPSTDLVKNMSATNDSTFTYKRKMVIRDWFYYLIWFNRFKKAIYGNAFKNGLQSEFSKYFNICCLPPLIGEDKLNNSGSNMNVNSNMNLNDSIYLKKSQNNSMIDPKNKDNKESNKKETTDLNPENINLRVGAEVLVKGVNIQVHPGVNITNSNEVIIIKLSEIVTKLGIIKDKCDLSFEIKNCTISNKNKVEVSKHQEEKLKHEYTTNINGGVSQTGHTGHNITSNKHSNMNLNLNFINETQHETHTQSHYQLLSPSGEETNSNNNMSIISNSTKTYNSKLNKKLNVLTETLDQLSKNANGGSTGNKFKTSSIHNNNNQVRPKVNFVNILLADENGNNTGNMYDHHQEKSKNVNLSKMINEYNKNIVKQKKVVTNVHGSINNNQVIKGVLHNNTNSISHANTDEKIDLNIIEITPNSTNSPAISIKLSKSINNKKVSESANFHLGLIRINVVQEYIYSTLPLIAEYPIVKKLESKLEKEKEKLKGVMNLKEQKHLYELKNLIINKLSKSTGNNPGKSDNNLFKLGLKENNNNNNQSNPEVTDYTNYLKKDLDNYDKSLFETGVFEVNYLFNMINNKNIEINFNYSNFALVLYSTANKHIKTITPSIMGKIKFPNLNMKLSFTNENFLFKFFDFELNFTENERLRLMLGFMVKTIEEKFKMNLILLEPMMKRIYEETNAHKEVKSLIKGEGNNLNTIPKEPINTNSNHAKKNSNFQIGLNIIQNNQNKISSNTNVTNTNNKGTDSKKKEKSLSESLNNTSYLEVNMPMNPESIFKNSQNENPPIINKKASNLNNHYTDTIQNDDQENIKSEDPSGIIGVTDEIENISDYEDLGITLEKEAPVENVKRIHSYNHVDSVRTEESRDKGGKNITNMKASKKNIMNINMK